MLCSSGGHFTKVPGGWEYQGGETRLVSVSNYCHMQELQDALHRVSQTMRLDLSSSSGSVQCPSAFLYILFADLLLFGARNVCHHRQSTHRPHAPGCRFWVPMSAEVTLPCHLICLSDTLVHAKVPAQRQVDHCAYGTSESASCKVHQLRCRCPTPSISCLAAATCMWI
jgi:hypothetical protein